jgi:hypothetical protein
MMVVTKREKRAPMRRMVAGTVLQKGAGPVRAEKRVKKSDTATFRYIIVTIFPYSIQRRPILPNKSLLSTEQESRAKYSSRSDEKQETAPMTDDTKNRAFRFHCADTGRSENLSSVLYIAQQSSW